MAAGYRGSYDDGGAANTNGSNLTFSLSGTNAVKGDVAIACIYSRANTKTVTSVSNVTQISGQYVSTANGGMIWLGQKVLTATDITNGYFGTYTLNSVSNGTVGYSVMVFSGVHGTTPIDATATPVSGGASLVPNPPTITHTAGSTIVVACGKMDDAGGTFTAPTTTSPGYTLAATSWWSTTSGTDGCSGLAYQLAVSGTSEDPGVFTTASGGLSTYWYAATISLALQPAPAISSKDVSSGTTAGGTTVTLTGTSFYGASAVTVGGHAATSFNVVSDTSMTLVTAAHAAEAGLQIQVTGPGGASADVAADDWEYTATTHELALASESKSDVVVAGYVTEAGGSLAPRDPLGMSGFWGM